MPELPEVETIRRGLEGFIKNAKIKRVNVFCDKSFFGNPKDIEGKRITSFRRFGKALIIDLENHTSLMIHLRMTGQLIFDKKTFAKNTEPDSKENSATRYAAGHPSENFVAALPNKQTRVELELENGKLYFNDQRKFGFIKLLKTANVENDPFIKKLAKEPWNMTADEFYEALQRHKNSCTKAVILDQSIICGLGNIYADESLFSAKIHPERKAGSLTKTEAKNLLESARAVMDKSINSGGSTMSTYVKADGTRGDYLEKFAQVFRREGKPCIRCGEKIIKIKVSGRGTHICPNCQRKGRA